MTDWWTGGTIYFFKPMGMAGPIKIGCSNSPKKRLAGAMGWSPFPLEIVAEIPGGGIALEHNLQQCFADAHWHNEWFHPIPRLLDAVAKIKAGVPVEIAVDLTKKLGQIRDTRKHYSPEKKMYLSYCHKLGHCTKRAARQTDNQYWFRLPRDAETMIDKWGRTGIAPSADGLRRLDEIIGDPARYCEAQALAAASSVSTHETAV